MVRKFAPLWKYFVVCYYIHKCFADNGVASSCFEGGMNNKTKTKNTSLSRSSSKFQKKNL
jgi:hypothetical protein